jgi:hypothetical protein
MNYETEIFICVFCHVPCQNIRVFRNKYYCKKCLNKYKLLNKANKLLSDKK